MTLEPRPILTDGATHPAQQFRNLVSDLARDNEGVTRGTDLKVTQLGTPGGSVQVSSGTGLVRGRYAAYQGTYAVMNVGSTNVDIAPTGGSPRSDMLIIRVEDKEYEGNIDPAVGEVNYFQIISNVSSSATAIPDGRTGIPLARIDIPASTSTITNAMIKDIRQVANPRRDRQMYPHSPATASTEITGSASSWGYFTTEAGLEPGRPSMGQQGPDPHRHVQRPRLHRELLRCGPCRLRVLPPRRSGGVCGRQPGNRYPPHQRGHRRHDHHPRRLPGHHPAPAPPGRRVLRQHRPDQRRWVVDLRVRGRVLRGPR